jgi:FkbM family methyltransferase
MGDDMQSINTSYLLPRTQSISGKFLRKAHETIIRTIANLPFGKEVSWRGYNYFLKRVWRGSFAGRTFFGAVIECDLKDVIQRTIFSFGIYEPRVTGIISQRLKEGSVFIDIGANVGYHTLLASCLVGRSGSVFSIEASPVNFATLQRNLFRNRSTNVVAINKAVSREPGRVVLYAGGPHTGLATTDASRGFPAVAEVEALPLERALDLQTLRKTRLIKMDVEGGEIPILEHILETRDLYSDDIEIIVELSVASDAVEWSKRNSILCRFFELGFKCYAVDDDYNLHAYFHPKAFEPKEITLYPKRQMEVFLTRSSL